MALCGLEHCLSLACSQNAYPGGLGQEYAQRKPGFCFWKAQVGEKKKKQNTKNLCSFYLYGLGIKYLPNFRCVFKKQEMNREGSRGYSSVRKPDLFIKPILTFNIY